MGRAPRGSERGAERDRRAERDALDQEEAPVALVFPRDLERDDEERREDERGLLRERAEEDRDRRDRGLASRVRPDEREEGDGDHRLRAKRDRVGDERRHG